MDRLDIRILRELFQARTVWPARPGMVTSYRRVARDLGAPPGTVRNRIREMARSGFLRGITVYPNPFVLGRRSNSYAIEVAPTVDKAGAVTAILRLPSVVFLENFHSRLVGVGIADTGDEDLQRTTAAIDRIAHAPGGLLSRVEHPPAGGPLGPAEWALLARLARGGFPTYAQLAAELKVSTRTLKRRLARLSATNAIMTFPRLDQRALRGAVAAELLVQFTSRRARDEAEQRVRDHLDPWLTFAGVWEEFVIYRLLVPNIAVANEAATAVGRMDGVRVTRTDYVLEFREHLDPLLREVEVRARSALVAERKRAAAPPPSQRSRRGRRTRGPTNS